jgi:ADP-ribosylglycohydrolase
MKYNSNLIFCLELIKMKHLWLYIDKEALNVEREQLDDEGKDISSIDLEFQRLLNSDLETDLTLQKEAQNLLDRDSNLPFKEVQPYYEPSDFKEIKAARTKTAQFNKQIVRDDAILDKLAGAWLGRCSGCLLGKPVEGWNTGRMWGYLKDMNRFPLDDYFTSQVPKEIIETYKINVFGPFINNIQYMLEDDDTNYTVAGLALLKKYGIDFTSEDVADFWMANIPILHTCTAERVAYKNFVQLIPPPQSAVYRNPYREWIGAQIRADIYGYVAMGNPELASKLAWKDARISHVKNGIYGSMWVAAMIAIAAVEDNIQKIIDTALTYIPENCRLTKAIKQVINWYNKGLDCMEAINEIHTQWKQHSAHHWCHTISNAQIVAMGLLWGEGDFEKAVCRAVQACFDTDCNGATVGSIMGMLLGSKRLPVKWVSPLNDLIETGIAGYNKVNISYLAQESCKLYKKFLQHPMWKQ